MTRGKRLVDLLNELSPSELNDLELRCFNASDKRMLFIPKILQIPRVLLEDWNDQLDLEIIKYFGADKQDQVNLKGRRMINYAIDQVEQIVIQSYFKKKSSMRSFILSKALESSGQVSLIKHYAEEGELKASKEENTLLKLLCKQALIQVLYHSPSEEDWKIALEQNEEYDSLIDEINLESKVTYYEAISTLYLEKNTLLTKSRDVLELEIDKLMKEVDSAYDSARLLFALAKLNYNTDKLDTYFGQAKSALRQIETKSEVVIELERRIRFMELRLGFFSGRNVAQLMHLFDDFLNFQKLFSLTNNHVMFYYILFLVLNGKSELGFETLKKNKLYFKGKEELLESFLFGLIAYTQGDHKKAIRLLNPIMYSESYFFAVFARFLIVKIHLKREAFHLAKSILDSTQLILKKNQGNPLGAQANLYTLDCLKKSMLKKNCSNDQVAHLTVLHKLILDKN
jgi:hypothetical protein